ncbi:MAG: hypothetical protein D6741_17550, partial [Planctomycetota bacterium]
MDGFGERFPRLTSRKNPRITAAARLRDGRQRRKTGRILIDGIREFVRAVDAGVVVEEVFFDHELFAARRCDLALKDDADRVAAFLEKRQAESGNVFCVPGDVFDKLAFGNRKDGIVAVCREPDTSFDAWVPRERGEPPLV